MQLLFLISLATGVTASYLTKHTSNEISYFMGTLALISLLSSLILAPWQIKLIILIIVIVSIIRVWQHIGIGEEPEIEPKDLDKFQHQQDSQQQDRVSPEELTGMYRGHPYPITHSEQNQISKTDYKLKYRGVNIIKHQEKPAQNDRE